MKTITYLLAFFLCGLIASCLHYPADPLFTNPLKFYKKNLSLTKRYKANLNLCRTRMQICRRACYDNYKTCSCLSELSTFKAYKTYKQEICVAGKRRMREFNSYRDPLECMKITCNCELDYKACNQWSQKKVRHTTNEEASSHVR